MLNTDKIVTCKVISIHDTHLIATLENGNKGLLHISEISDYYVREINSIFKIGNTYDFQIIENKDGKIKLSWKKINPRFMKNPFKFSLKDSNDENEKLFSNLERKLND